MSLNGAGTAHSHGHMSVGMDDLSEWQMLHVGICEDIKGKMESLPNLNGVKGKGRYAKRHPPSLISLSD